MYLPFLVFIVFLLLEMRYLFKEANYRGLDKLESFGGSFKLSTVIVISLLLCFLFLKFSVVLLSIWLNLIFLNKQIRKKLAEYDSKEK